MSSDSVFIHRAPVRNFTTPAISSRQIHTESAEEIRGFLGLRVQHSPKTPLVEFIFVHGIPGGSRRSWSYNCNDSSTFWPKEWLPTEVGFESVRVHTFGYEVDWSGPSADANKINLIGKMLLDSIANSHSFRKTNSNPVVLIAHSLGGLVIKKAFNDAKSDPRYEDIARRIHSMFFLGTPHQGYDNQSMVTSILRVNAWDGKTCEVDPNFAIVANDINENFRHSYYGVRVYSFYETPTPYQGSKTIVGYDAANFGSTEHLPVPLSADHVGLARFHSISDSAYQQLRSQLVSVVEDILNEFSDPEKIQAQMRLIGDHLNINESEEDEVASLDIVEGSCVWLLEKEPFSRWRDNGRVANGLGLGQSYSVPKSSPRSSLKDKSQDTARIFWLLGSPGSGKSHLASYTIQHLEKYGNCSYYFLKHTDRSRHDLGRLLKSIAYQMAKRDPNIRRALLSMQEEGSLTAEESDIRMLWKQLFIQKILKVGFQTTQFWIIDALDEGNKGQELIKLFDKIPSNLPLKILVTSRPTSQLSRDVRGLSIITLNIEVEDTLDDIRLFIEENRGCIHVDDSTAEQIIDKILERSRGSFLWTRIILDHLSTLWNYKAIDRVMEEIPDDMNAVYQRIVDDMASRPQDNKELAKAILRWTVCASRSLTTFELQEAIQRDIKDSVPLIDKMISDVCGQLVIIDKQGKVRLVHDTARDFLLKPDLECEFAVDRNEAQARVAHVCLQYLIEGEGRQISRMTGMRSNSTPCALHEYAHLFFSEHVLKGLPADTGVIDTVIDFFDTRILYTVEYIARYHDMRALAQIGKNLDAWIDRRRDQTPLDSRMKIVQGWATDIIRLVTVFGRYIVSNPNCVHTAIPPLCPPNSQIYRQYGRNSPAMEVVGLAKRGWSDRIFNAPFPDDFIGATACMETTFAVGLRSGIVVLYNAATCQETRRLNHKAQVMHLEFSTLQGWILVSGQCKLSLWDYTSGEILWSTSTSSETMALGFFENDAIIASATKNNHIVYHAVSDGSVLNEISWHGAEQSNRHVRPPMHVFMSSELGFVAVVYKNQPVWLLSLSNLARPRYFGGQSNAIALAFNIALKMIVVGFFDGEVCTFSLATLQKVAAIPMDAEHLIVSGDGKTLAIGDKTGQIKIYNFETLHELYTVGIEDVAIVSLMFSTSGLQILDARRKEFNMWQPSALYRRNDADEDGSQGRTSYGTALTQPYQNSTGADAILINCIASHQTGDYVFCGKADGSVCVYRASTGKIDRTLFFHESAEVLFLDWNAAREVLVSSDSSNRVMVHKAQLKRFRTKDGNKEIWEAISLFEHRSDSPIRQILSSTDGEYLLISDPTSEHIWTLEGVDKLQHRCEHPETSKAVSQKWAAHTRHKFQLFEIGPHGAHALSWPRDSTAMPQIEGVVCNPDERIDFETRDYGVHFVKFGKNATGQTMWAAYDNDPFTPPIIWEQSTANGQDSTTDAALEWLNRVAPEVQSLISMHKFQLFFLSQEGWLCSMSVDKYSQGKIHTRHFPVPHCWRSLNRRLVAMVTPRGDFVLARGAELAIVKRGLNLSFPASRNG